jgi:RNA polymerase sigma-70 factor (ECF subfamily)
MLFDTVIVAIKHKLTEDQRHVIILRYLEGFSLRETADIMGKEVYNVKVIQNRGVAKLRKALLGSKVV